MAPLLLCVCLQLSSVPQLRAKRQQQTVQLHWRLLVTPPQELGQQLEQLMQVLAGLAHRHVVKLVCGEPRLLGRDPAQLLSTVEALEQVSRGARGRGGGQQHQAGDAGTGGSLRLAMRSRHSICTRHHTLPGLDVLQCWLDGALHTRQ